MRKLTVNGAIWNKAHLDYGALAGGATLDFDLTTVPATSWARGPGAAPPSDPAGEQPALTSVSPGGPLILTPASQSAASLEVTNVTGQPLTVGWTASAASGVTVSPASETLTVPAGSAAVTVTAGAGDGVFPVDFTARTATGETLRGTTLTADVADPVICGPRPATPASSPTASRWQPGSTPPADAALSRRRPPEPRRPRVRFVDVRTPGVAPVCAAVNDHDPKRLPRSATHTTAAPAGG